MGILRTTLPEENQKEIFTIMTAFSTSVGNDDGLGMVNKSWFIRTGMSGEKYIKSEEYKEFLKNNWMIPVYAHVRNAVSKTLLGKPHAHPFIIDNITLMHNGVFSDLETKDKIDTQVFTEMLAKEVNKKRFTIDALNRVIDKIRYGSFSLVISDGFDWFLIPGIREIYTAWFKEGDTLLYNTSKEVLESTIEFWSAIKGTTITPTITKLENYNVYKVDSNGNPISIGRCHSIVYTNLPTTAIYGRREWGERAGTSPNDDYYVESNFQLATDRSPLPQQSSRWAGDDYHPEELLHTLSSLVNFRSLVGKDTFNYFCVTCNFTSPSLISADLAILKTMLAIIKKEEISNKKINLWRTFKSNSEIDTEALAYEAAFRMSPDFIYPYWWNSQARLRRLTNDATRDSWSKKSLKKVESIATIS
jgi:hypothetical protein